MTGRVIFLALALATTGSAHAKPAQPRPASKASPARPSAAELRRGVRCKQPGHCTLSRALVERYLADLGGLGADVQVTPAEREGQPGFALTKVRRGSIFARLGLREGDLVDSVNGLAVSSPALAMAAFWTLRNADHFTVRIVRHGEPLTLDYWIR